MSVFTVDINKILRDKAGDKARYVPGFVVNWLKKIIHQDEINQFFVQEGDKQGVPWLDDALEFLDMTLHVEGRENLPAPDDGKHYTFVSNHPLGGIDGVAIGQVLGHQYNGHIKYIVNDLLMNIHGLAPFFIGVNKFGKQGHNFAVQVDEMFNSDNNVIIFPADLCSRRNNGVIHDLPWKKTFVSKSVETHRDVVPMFFEGQNSNFFYRLANISKKLGIKFNIAMLFLVDEMFKNRGKTFTLHIGKPIPWQTFDSSKTHREWALYVEDIVYKIPEKE